MRSKADLSHATYERAIKNESIIGGPTLADLISQVSGCDLDISRRRITTIQTFWREDILSQRKSKQQDTRNSNNVISVSEAIRLLEGQMIVAGKVAGISALQPMISKVHLECSECLASRSFGFTSKPVWRSPVKERDKPNFCECKEGN
jgi:hypothetical protein